MIEPTLHHLSMPGPLSKDGAPRRMAWWEWNASGQAHPRHVIVCVHGLSRQGRDFDVLAAALAPHARVIAVDVAGRGHSDWLQDPMAYQVPIYANDVAVLLAHLRQDYASAADTSGDPADMVIDWVGTSMGGLIGIGLAAQPAIGLRRLVLNDVGPEIAWQAIERIGAYLGRQPVFPTEQAAADYLKMLSVGFGPHSPEQWMALSRPMLRPVAQGWTLHYDPDIAAPVQALLQQNPDVRQQVVADGEKVLWTLYDAIHAQVLLLRGAESDLLTPETARRMTERGPRARCVEFAGVGHAPTLVAADQVDVVKEFLLSP